MNVADIIDAADARVADFRELRDADVRPERRGVVIAEGLNVVARLLASPYPVRAVFGVPARLRALAELVPPARLAGVPVLRAGKDLLSQVAGFPVTRGVLAAAGRLAEPPLPPLLAGAGGVLVCEAINDFENLGAIFRNAAAFGVRAVLLDPRTADPLYRRSVRVSMGYALTVPFARLPGHWPESLGVLRQAGFTLAALSPAGEQSLTQWTTGWSEPSGSAGSAQRAAGSAQQFGQQPGPRWALLLGAEGPGLSPAALAAAAVRLRIPMAPGVDSLNVATAAAVALAHLAHLSLGEPN